MFLNEFIMKCKNPDLKVVVGASKASINKGHGQYKI